MLKRKYMKNFSDSIQNQIFLPTPAQLSSAQLSSAQLSSAQLSSNYTYRQKPLNISIISQINFKICS